MSESPDCYTAERPKARKPHKCCECRGIIQPGETYHRFSGVWNGEAETYKTCEDCDQLRRDVIRDGKLHLDEIPAFGNLCDDMESLKLKRRFVGIMEKRGAVVHQSWRDSIRRMEEAK